MGGDIALVLFVVVIGGAALWFQRRDFYPKK